MTLPPTNSILDEEIDELRKVGGRIEYPASGGWVVLEMVIIPANVTLGKRTEASLVQYNAILNFTIALVTGLLLGSYVEYTVHRLMHKGKILGKRHAKHHRKFEAQGWWGEFADYLLPGLLIAWAGFLVSIPAGVGFALGTVACGQLPLVSI